MAVIMGYADLSNLSNSELANFIKLRVRKFYIKNLSPRYKFEEYLTSGLCNIGIRELLENVDGYHEGLIICSIYMRDDAKGMEYHFNGSGWILKAIFEDGKKTLYMTKGGLV